jgi:hypothetical protein
VFLKSSRSGLYPSLVLVFSGMPNSSMKAAVSSWICTMPTHQLVLVQYAAGMQRREGENRGLTMIVLLFFTGLNAPGFFCSFEKPAQLWSICSRSRKSVGKKMSASPCQASKYKQVMQCNNRTDATKLLGSK